MSILDENIGHGAANNNDLQVTGNLKNSWMSISKWAKFFAILGFIQITASVLMVGTVREVWESILMMSRGSDEITLSFFSKLMEYLLVFAIIGGIVMFFVHFYHLRFSNDIQNALRTEDQNRFERSWVNLRNHFRIFGYVVIAGIVLYFGTVVYLMSSFASAMQQMGE